MKHPTDAAGRKMYLSEFEFENCPHLSYDDMLDAVQDDAYEIAVQYMDDEGTEEGSNERWAIWDTDARRVRDEFEAFYKDELLKLSASFA
jgi:hypothetical protein